MKATNFAEDAISRTFIHQCQGESTHKGRLSTKTVSLAANGVD